MIHDSNEGRLTKDDSTPLPPASRRLQSGIHKTVIHSRPPTQSEPKHLPYCMTGLGYIVQRINDSIDHPPPVYTGIEVLRWA